MVFYRKYRPQLISELDLSVVREKLTSILSSQNIPHAFLFAGPKGLGKTSSARILAKAINCEKKGKGVEPCNVCSACISITNGSNVDVLEIDAASNRGIDEIRDLRDRIKFSPAALQKKVYIIDEVHMLTTEAFNALLKTLEEPPAHAVFILCTTETHKLPATIMSRVFLVSFEKPTSEELARSLERVVSGEKLDVEEGVLSKIAELSDGAFRDGTKILEELSLQSNGKKITNELLERIYKSGSIDSSVLRLIELLGNKDAKAAMDVVDLLSQNNADFKQVIEKMASNLHAQLLVFVSKGKKDDIHTTQKLLGLLDQAYKGLRGAVLPQLPLELAVIEYCIEPVETNTYQVVSTEVKKETIVAEVVAPTPVASTHANPPSNKAVNNDSNIAIFKQLVESVNSENKILAGLLRGCRIEDLSSSTMHIKAPSSFHMRKLTEPQNAAVVQTHMNKVLQKEVAIAIKS